MHPRRRTAAAVTILLILALAGCDGAPKPTSTNPALPSGTRTPAPVKAWVVLHEADDGIGYSTNWGSRLTEGEMRSYMQNLLKNAKIFGPDAKFTWDGELRIVRPMGGPKPQDRRVGADQSTTLMNIITARLPSPPQDPFGWNDPFAINIYFAGYVQGRFDAPSAKPIGWTINPGMTGQEMHDYWRPFVLINDEDWNTGVHLGVSTTRLILEHEIGHYLIRYETLNDLYGAQTNYQHMLYDWTGHFVAWPSSVDTDAEKKAHRHLMKAGGYAPLAPVLDDLSREHTNRRFFDNRWREPQ